MCFLAGIVGQSGDNLSANAHSPFDKGRGEVRTPRFQNVAKFIEAACVFLLPLNSIRIARYNVPSDLITSMNASSVAIQSCLAAYAPRPGPAGLAATTHVYSLKRYAEVVEWVWKIHHSLSPDAALVAVSVILPFPVPGSEGGFMFVLAGVAFSASRDEALKVLEPLAESPFLGEALFVQHAQPTTIAERLEFAGAIHPPGMRYLVDSAWVEGPSRDIIAATKKLVAERPSGTRGHAFFDFALPRPDAPDMAMSLRTDVMLGSYIIYEGEQNDDAYRTWHLDAIKPLEPFTVGQYWGDSDQALREVKTLTDDAWTRLQQIRAKRDPHGLFADYLAGPGGFRNRNGWEAGHSKVMAWVAFDRAASEQEGFNATGQRWREIADEIHAEICERGFDRELNSFVQAYDSKRLDASLPLIPLVGFLPAADPRVRGTLRAIEDRLLIKGEFVLRYETENAGDGLPAGEGAFLACSFWLVDNYILQGRCAEARSLIDRLLSRCNDVGLLAEEFDPLTGLMLGNFPQAYGHVGLINCALSLSRQTGPAEERAESQVGPIAVEPVAAAMPAAQ